METTSFLEPQSSLRRSQWIDGRSGSLTRVAARLSDRNSVSAEEILVSRPTEKLRIAAEGGLHTREDVLLSGPETVDKVEFLPLDRLISEDEVAQVARVVSQVLPTGRFTSGPYVDQFEDELARFIGLECVAGTSSGTEALMASLVAVGVEPGTEVVLPANSFAATENAVLTIGATPVYADIESESLGLDPESVRKVVTSRTSAILPVHLYGRRCDMVGLSQVASEVGLAVVEDACQAIGLADLGIYSDAVALSFNPYKNLGGTGKAGAAASRSQKVHHRLVEYLYHGFEPGRKNIKSAERGLNARLDNMQAAILAERFKHLGLNNLRRTLLAQRYGEALGQYPEVTAVPELTSEHTWHLYPIRVPVSARTQIREYAAAHGVHTDLYYPVLSHHQPALAHISEELSASLKNTEETHGQLVHLPLYPALGISEQEHVIDVFTAALETL